MIMMYTKRKKKFGIVRKKSKDEYNAYVDSLAAAEQALLVYKRRKRRGGMKSRD